MARSKFDRNAVRELFKQWVAIPNRAEIMQALTSPEAVIIQKVSALTGKARETFELLVAGFEAGAPVAGATSNIRIPTPAPATKRGRPKKQPAPPAE